MVELNEASILGSSESEKSPRTTLISNPNPGGRCQSIKGRHIQVGTVPMESYVTVLTCYASI